MDRRGRRFARVGLFSLAVTTSGVVWLVFDPTRTTGTGFRSRSSATPSATTTAR